MQHTPTLTGPSAAIPAPPRPPSLHEYPASAPSDCRVPWQFQSPLPGRRPFGTLQGSGRSRGGHRGSSRTVINRTPTPAPLHSGSDASTAAAAPGGYESPRSSARLFDYESPVPSPRPQWTGSGAPAATPPLLRVRHSTLANGPDITIVFC
jgi:hypothetical protein